MYLQKIESYFKNNALPIRDLHSLPLSAKTFKGGAHYRMELASAECAENFEALVKAAQEKKLQKDLTTLLTKLANVDIVTKPSGKN